MIRRLAAPASLRPRSVLLIGAVVGSLALGGCASGQVAQTANQVNNGGGADVAANGILVRAAQITFAATPQGAAVYPSGGSAPVEMRVVNQGTQDDKLVSASSPIAASVQISGQSDLPAGVAMVVGGQTATGSQATAEASQPPSKSSVDSTGAPSSSGATPSSSGAAPSSATQEPSDTSPTGSSNASGEAPAGGLQGGLSSAVKQVEPSTRYATVVLTGLREDIKAGMTYEIDLTFERAGQVRVMLPVAYPGAPRKPDEQGG